MWIICLGEGRRINLYMYKQVTAYIRERVSVPDEALEKAFSYSRIEHYKKGDIILRAGEYCEFIGYMNAGLIMVTVDDNTGKEVICNFFFENEFFTHVESINERVQSDKNFIAMEDCEILMLKKSECLLVFSVHPAFEELFNLIVLEDLKRIIRYTQERQSRSIEERYLYMMETQASLFNRVPLKFIAGYLGVAPPSLSRLRKRLVNK
jgi:CRP-like cAMP-binding protein